MSKHTPGPWVTKRHLFQYEYGYPIFFEDRTKPGLHTRRLDDAGTGHFKESDARLIAAAPDYHDAAFWIRQAVAANAAPVNPLAALEELALDGEHITLDAGLVLDLLKAHAKATGVQQ